MIIFMVGIYRVFSPALATLWNFTGSLVSALVSLVHFC
jgi:hypothetical protein